MPLPELTKKKVEVTLSKFYESVVPPEVRNDVRWSFEFEKNSVTLFENQIHWIEKSKWTKFPISKFRFNSKSKEWTLYWRDRNLKWHLYQDVLPTKDFESILKEVKDDPTGIFWG